MMNEDTFGGRLAPTLKNNWLLEERTLLSLPSTQALNPEWKVAVRVRWTCIFQHSVKHVTPDDTIMFLLYLTLKSSYIIPLKISFLIHIA